MQTKRIGLSRGASAVVDADDYEYLAQFNWHLSDQGYALGTINKKRVRMHRIVNDTPDGFETDHINRNKLDNRRSNLRTATRSENTLNKAVVSPHKKYLNLPEYVTFDIHRSSYVVRKPARISETGSIIARHFRTLEKAVNYLNTWKKEAQYDPNS